MRLATVGKLLGVAGLAGVAATGVVLARDERQRRAYTPDDVRARLHARAEAAARAPQPGDGALYVVPPAPSADGRRARWRRLLAPATTAVGSQVSRLRTAARRQPGA